MRMTREARITFVALMVACAGEACALPQAKFETKTKQSAIRYEIRGVVVNAIDGSTIPHCHLSPSLPVRGGFNSRQFPSSIGVFDADEHGQFSIALPSAGAWRLTASARGFVTQAYEEHQGFSSAVVLTAGAPAMEIRFRLGPEASITGVVVDEAGEAVRNAQVSLQIVPPASPGGPQPAESTGGATQTDDRGMYEFDNLEPGSYRVRVQARPWYAAMSQSRGTVESDAAPLDPSLDFAYPVTWFPGVADPEMAETLVMHAGDTRQADFHLTPMPSIHLRIVPRVRTNGTGNDVPVQTFPLVEQISQGGAGTTFVPTTAQTDRQGQMDIGGLTPGLYQVRLMGPNQDGRSTLVDVAANSARTIDLNGSAHDVATITLRFEGADDRDAEPGFRRGGPMQVSLIDVDTHGRRFSSSGGLGRGSDSGRGGAAADRTVEVPPGRYEVVLQGRPNLFLTSLSATGAEVSGRYVTVPAGESTLTVHVASGRAHVSGVAMLQGKPIVGAMVLLVPITIEDAGSITLLRRDQTNTDGSFDVEDVIPGKYILVAIDHGWEINWGDRSTLRRYLMRGVPVELKSSAAVKQNVEAQAP